MNSNWVKFSAGASICILFAFSAVSCDENQKVGSQNQLKNPKQVSRSAVSSENERNRKFSEGEMGSSFPTSENNEELAELGVNVLSLVSEKGAEAISLIFDSYNGSQRDQAMTIALSQLVKQVDRSVLLEQLGNLPAGETKQKWIWQAVSKGQLSSDASFFEVIKRLDYSEDRKTAINAYASNSEYNSSDDFNKALHFLQNDSGVDVQFAEAMSQTILRKYSAGLMVAGADSVVSGIRQLPENYQKSAVEISMKAFAGSERVSEALALAGLLESSPDLAKQAYTSGFEVVGKRDPSSMETWLPRVPDEYRTDAITGFVGGWLDQDSQAASKWAADQTGADLNAAAQAVVNYLENRKAPKSDILPWRAILDKKSP